MYIHGSFASILRGDPVEREPDHYSDIDIYGTQEELDQLFEAMQLQDNGWVTGLPTRFASRTYIVRRIRYVYRMDRKAIKNIEYEVMSPEILDAFAALPDNQPVSFFGLDAEFVSEATDVAIKEATLHHNRPNQKLKHEKDIKKYKDKGAKLLKEHKLITKLLTELRDKQYAEIK